MKEYNAGLEHRFVYHDMFARIIGFCSKGNNQLSLFLPLVLEIRLRRTAIRKMATGHGSVLLFILIVLWLPGRVAVWRYLDEWYRCLGAWWWLVYVGIVK